MFFRTKQGVAPTSQGTLFYANARVLSDAWKSVAEGIQESKTELQGKFRVGCHPSVGAYTITQLISQLNSEAPGISIELIHDFSVKITEKVVSYGLDMGYVVNPSKHPDLVLRKIGNDRVTLWKKRGMTRVPKRIFADTDIHEVHEVHETLERAHSMAFQD